MKLIEPSFEILEQGHTLDDIYKHIELCGRTCYKSTDKITAESAKPFVDNLIKRQHYAMLEHGTIYLYAEYSPYTSLSIQSKFRHLPYTVYREYSLGNGDIGIYITTNLRVILEHGLGEYLKYQCKPTKHHERRVTVRFVCNRQVSHEFVRHRVFSFAQESTRYCNYSLGKFGGELTFIEPCWLNERTSFGEHAGLNKYLTRCEELYLSLLDQGWKPQQAATVLPNALKTELIMTGFVSDWKHFFDLRALGTTGKPHPQASELAIPLMEEFKNRKYI